MSPEYLRYRILWPLVPAMAMVMIDFTIVSISATTIQGDLGLSDTGVQWLVTGYALSTAAFVALGGRLGDILGHRRIVVLGVLIFAAGSLMCGLVPDSGDLAEPWLIVFRVVQGIGGALLIPSTTVLVLNAFPPEERGKGLATFFIIAGLFTAVGPIAGSYLTEFWTWRAIFWINVPVAILALTEMGFVKLSNVKHPSSVDWLGAFFLIVGMGLAVLGIQQSTVWGWGDPATIGSIAGGVILLVAFIRFEQRIENPLIDVKTLAANRAFAVDNLLTFLIFAPWLAVFFFGSMYFQVAVHQQPTQAGFSILTMFYTYFVGARVGGGWMDSAGAKKPVEHRLPARHDRDGRLGPGAVPARPCRDDDRDAADGRGLRPRPLAAEHRRAQPPAGLDARSGIGHHADLPRLRFRDRHGGDGNDHRRRHRPGTARRARRTSPTRWRRPTTWAPGSWPSVSSRRGSGWPRASRPEWSDRPRGGPPPPLVLSAVDAIDIACHQGWFTTKLLDAGVRSVRSVDVRPEHLDDAELITRVLGYDAARTSFQRFDVGDPRAYPLEGEYDIVLMLGLLYHLENPVGALRVARKHARRLAGASSSRSARSGSHPDRARSTAASPPRERVSGGFSGSRPASRRPSGTSAPRSACPSWGRSSPARPTFRGVGRAKLRRRDGDGLLRRGRIPGGRVHRDAAPDGGGQAGRGGVTGLAGPNARVCRPPRIEGSGACTCLGLGTVARHESPW